MLTLEKVSTVAGKGHLNGCVKFEFNSILSLYTKNDSKW